MGRLISCVCLLLSLNVHGMLRPSEADRPALIPLPQQLTWQTGTFPLADCKTIVIGDSTLRSEAVLLRQTLGVDATITTHAGNMPSIVLELSTVEALQNPEEAYSLVISTNRVNIKANTNKGVFYAIQTLRQLIQQGTVPACEVTDWPAFAWRGYMVDVGRNFQSMELLKQQIDVMAAYKLNIFHFHFTEDIAWRLASKRYPQLTAPDNMLRNPGKHYTQEDLHELIAYCRQRHITLLPEIDMPGHSAAFTRAMGTDMQSDTGMVYVKNILEEFCDAFDLPYIHIGGDEVKITNERFLPEMVAYLESRGRETIGWDPGGNLPHHTIRQLWMEGPTPIPDTSTMRFIDSKHLYLNHMDPLETVTTLFHRQIGASPTGNANLLGGINCSWPDRAVANESDVLFQNAIYPGIVTFGERSWRGGGVPGWVSNIGAPETEAAAAFSAFEKRLLSHKERYFTDKPFPYVEQSGLRWKLYGPYQNDGDLAMSFPPEIADFDSENTQPTYEAIGATLILRHWWADVIPGLIKFPQEHTTWYATTRIWSDEGGKAPFWIGFDNFSRSYASDSPLPGTWDNRGSEVWVNGIVIPPPNWKQGGMKGHLEKPLLDEGYSFRAPTVITLKKGWNTVLVKLPVGTFKGKDWQKPVKWMFTFTPAP